MKSFWHDLRHGLRTLAQKPGFTAVAVLTLALGIGANTALFSVVNGVLLKQLPYPLPDQLVSLYEKQPESQAGGTAQELGPSYPNFLDWQKANRTFSSMAAYRQDDFGLTGAGQPEWLSGAMISASFVPLLGIKPVTGRAFTAEDDRMDAQPVALISAGLWERRFGSSPQIVDQSITLSGNRYTLVGVIPTSFHFDRRNDVYVPIGQWSDPMLRDRRNHTGTLALGRLKPGVTLAQARGDMDEVARNLAAAYPEADRDKGIALVPLKKDIVGEVQAFLLVLLGAVGFVQLIACVNVANLLLARSTGRTHEFAIRAALGASRRRVIQQLLTESILLAVSGGTLGLIVAAWGAQAALSFLPESLPRVDEIGLDARVLTFKAVISVLAGMLFGAAPALKISRLNLQETLKGAGRGSTAAHHRIQGVLVASEMALAFVLLIGAGLMIRSLARLWSVNPGFNPHNLLTFQLSPPASIATSPDGMRFYFRQVHQKLAAISGVAASSVAAGFLPMTGGFSAFPFWLEGQPKPASLNDMNLALWYAVEPDYFRAMQIPLQRGRLLNLQDAEHSPFVIVIDEVFAHKYFGHLD